MSIETILRDEFAVVITALQAGKIDGAQAISALLSTTERDLADLIRDALTGDEAVEAAARALIDSPDPVRTWLSMEEEQRERYRNDARAAIAALVETIGGSRS